MTGLCCAAIQSIFFDSLVDCRVAVADEKSRET
jgi:hypothetical protein